MSRGKLGWSFVFTVIVGAVMVGLYGLGARNSKAELGVVSPPASLNSKKILYVDSYHAEYPWSAGIFKGIRGVLSTHDEVELCVSRMDTKRNTSEAFKQESAERAAALIRDWNPDLVLVSDDNAIKYLVEPFLNNRELPVVFCGANWDIDRYSLATNKNVTGMIEVAHYVQIVDVLKTYTRGSRIGYLAGNNPSTASEFSALKKCMPDCDVSVYAVGSFEAWRSALLRACAEVDMLLINNNGGITGWDADVAKQLVFDHVTIPTGSSNEWMAEYNMIIFAKDASEQGERAAQMALEILGGKPVEQIPVVQNIRAKIVLNMRLAKKIGIRLPMDLIENAHLIGSE